MSPELEEAHGRFYTALGCLMMAGTLLALLACAWLAKTIIFG